MSDKLKLAVDCRMIGSGGIGTYFESVLPYLLDSFDCFLFGQADKVQKYESKVSKILITDIPPFSFAELSGFPQNILQEINSCDAFYNPYCNVPNGIKVPVFSTIHDVVFLDIKDLAGFAGTKIRKYFYQRAVNKSRVIFTVSNFSKERIVYHLNMHKKEPVITYNAVPDWFLDDVEQKVRKTDTILFVGNIKKHKGLKTLLDAFQLCRQNGLKAKLMIVGNRQNFRTGDKAVTSKLDSFTDGSVVFTGRVSDRDLKTIYAQAKLFVQPSLYEGFGIPPMEALSLKTNALISDIPVFKEIYKDFPVSFFEAGNADDLSEQIMKNFDKPFPKGFKNPYSYKATAEIIIKTIKDNL